MESPKNLSHRPIISVNGYEKKDAQYCDTDAKALSIGESQYDDNDISLKVWRYDSERWNSRSEELPIHRNLDLSILFLASLLIDKPDKCPKSSLGEVVDNPDKLQLIQDFYENHKQFFNPRLTELRRLIDKVLPLKHNYMEKCKISIYNCQLPGSGKMYIARCECPVPKSNVSWINARLEQKIIDEYKLKDVAFNSFYESNNDMPLVVLIADDGINGGWFNNIFGESEQKDFYI